jgi:hypothetical protein
MKVARWRGPAGVGGQPAGGVKAQTVPCPTCNKPAGRRCVSLRTSTEHYLSQCHKARVAAWKAART